ncbi:hypothetical protein [Diplocloster agilis]|nr:hypothetical protein [Suonthocola fibrivorans]MCU6735881.1 hypothetical protein [Suonthocola fibrivorans]
MLEERGERELRYIIPGLVPAEAAGAWKGVNPTGPVLKADSR